MATSPPARSRTPGSRGSGRQRAAFWRPAARANLSLRARVLLQSALQLSGKATTMLSGVVLFPILTRYLGVDAFGSYIFVTGYISLFAVVTDLGSQAIAVREMSRHGDRAAAVAGQFFTAKAALSAGATTTALLIALLIPVPAFHKPGVMVATTVCALALLFAPLGGTATAIFQMALRMGLPVVTDIAARLLVLAGVAVLALGVVGAAHTPAARLDAVLILATAVGIAGAVVTFVGAQRVLRFRPIMYDPAILLPMVRDAVPLAIVLVVGIIHYRIDVFILATMRGNASVGLYGIATKLLDVSLAISAMFMSVAFPVLSKRASGDPLLLRRAFQKSLDFMLITGLGIALLAAILSPSLVHFLGGARFKGSVVPLAVIAWAVPVMFVNQVFSHMVVAGNRQRVGVPVVLSAAIANIALNVALIPHLGTVAPSLVTVATESLSAAGMAVIMVRYFRFGPEYGSVLRIAAAAAVAAPVMLLATRFGAVIAGCAGLSIYFGGLLASGVVSRADLVALVRRPTPA